MELPIPALDSAVRRPLPAAGPRWLAAALFVLDGLLTLATAVTSERGMGFPWVADVATGLTELGLASSMLDADFEGGWLGLWAALCGVASVAAQASDGPAFDGLLRVPGAMALVLATVSRPRRFRTTLASALLGLQACAFASDLSSLRTGRSALGELRLRFDDQLGAPQPLGLTGQPAPYHVSLPPFGRWFDFIPAPEAQVVPYDRWVVEPARTALLRVRVEPVPGAAHLDLDTLVTRAEHHHLAAELLSAEPLPDAFDGARLIHLEEPRGPHRRGFWIGVFVRADLAFEVTAEAPVAAFSEIGEALRASVAGFSYEPTTPPSLDAETLAALKHATALVRTEASAGSGVLIATNEQGSYVLTNAHVMQGEGGGVPEHISVWFPEGGDTTRHPAELVQASSMLDLALLRIEPLPIDPLPLRLTRSLPDETPAFASGFPMGPHLAGAPLAQPTINAGRLLGRDPGGGRRVALGLNPGNSGGPVVASDGSVLGLAQAMVPDSETSVMVPSESIRTFLPATLPAAWNAGALPDRAGIVPPLEARIAIESALVKVTADGEVGPGLVVEATPSRLLIVGRADLSIPEESETLTVSFTPLDGSPMAVPAEFLGVDAQSGLVLLSVEPFPGAPAPPALVHLAALPETTPLQSVGWRVRTSPFVPKEPVLRVWRSGVLSSKQADTTGRLTVALADVGINPDLRGGPIIDAQGALLGFTTRDGDPTNLTRLAPTETIERLLAMVSRGDGGAAP